MVTDNELRRQLAKPEVDTELENKIRKNWQHQLAEAKNTQYRFVWRVASFSLAGVLLFTLSMTVVFRTPDIVKTAYMDIEKDKFQNVGLTIPASTWLKDHNIHMPPAKMVIEMTKYCNLAGQQTTHLQIAGHRQGEVHLFIRRGEFDATHLAKSEGNFNSMPWQLLEPREELSVLVLYSSDMDAGNVKAMLNTMFYT